MMPQYAVKIIVSAAILLCIACAATPTTSEGPIIRASSFIYDAHAKPIKGGMFIYDAKAPAIHASKFEISKI